MPPPVSVCLRSGGRQSNVMARQVQTTPNNLRFLGLHVGILKALNLCLKRLKPPRIFVGVAFHVFRENLTQVQKRGLYERRSGVGGGKINVMGTWHARKNTRHALTLRCKKCADVPMIRARVEALVPHVELWVSVLPLVERRLATFHESSPAEHDKDVLTKSIRPAPIFRASCHSRC